jgi:hypothetical protein
MTMHRTGCSMKGMSLQDDVGDLVTKECDVNLDAIIELDV